PAGDRGFVLAGALCPAPDGSPDPAVHLPVRAADVWTADGVVLRCGGAVLAGADGLRAPRRIRRIYAGRRAVRLCTGADNAPPVDALPDRLLHRAGRRGTPAGLSLRLHFLAYLWRALAVRNVAAPEDLHRRAAVRAGDGWPDG